MRQDQFQVTLSIDDVPFGVWDALSGGEIDSEETKYKPGGMAAQVSLGGSVNVGNITLKRLEDLGVMEPLVKTLAAKVGKGRCKVTRTPLDTDGNALPLLSLVYTGTLKTVTPAEHDSTGSDAAQIELEISTGGTIG